METKDADCSVVAQHIRLKSVEVYGPILHVWETTSKVLAEERPRLLKIDVQNKWLRAVLHALLEDMSPM